MERQQQPHLVKAHRQLEPDHAGTPPPNVGPRAYLPLALKQLPTFRHCVRQGIQHDRQRAHPGAQVCVVSTNQCSTTNAEGNYSIAQVPSGNKSVKATANGFTQLTQTGNVPGNGTLTLNFSLSPTLAAGEIPHRPRLGAKPKAASTRICGCRPRTRIMCTGRARQLHRFTLGLSGCG